MSDLTLLMANSLRAVTLDLARKFNDSHDDQGRFSSDGGGGGSGSTENQKATAENPVIRHDSAKRAAKDADRKKNGMSDKAKKAQAAHKYVGADVQRYSEEHNEPILAKSIGGVSLRDNEPVDVVIHDKGGQIQHGVELKTMTDNANGKITMSAGAIDKKMAWAKKNHADFHTIVYDDSAVKDANGLGKHDDSQRKMYYRRGAGSFRVTSMQPVENAKELKTLINTPTKDLPAAAKPTDSYPRIKKR
jgi:hypothetical protein